MHVAITFLVAGILCEAGAVKTGALLQTLPEDGSWATYHVVVNGDGKDVSLTWKLSSVGFVDCGGIPCRYLEVEQSCDNGSQQIYIYTVEPRFLRMLIPESSFGQGKDPLQQALKIWAQVGDEGPVVIESIDEQDPILAAIVRGPVSDLKEGSEQEKITWRGGELACSVLSGSRDMNFGGVSLQFKSSVLRNDELPFSIGGLRQEIKTVFNGQEYKVSIKAMLRDHGTDAKAKLPELVP